MAERTQGIQLRRNGIKADTFATHLCAPYSCSRWMTSAEDKPIFPFPLTDAAFPALAELVADAALGALAVDPSPLVGDILENLYVCGE